MRHGTIFLVRLSLHSKLIDCGSRFGRRHYYLCVLKTIFEQYGGEFARTDDFLGHWGISRGFEFNYYYCYVGRMRERTV